MAPRAPPKRKKPKKGYFWSLGTQMAYQKNFRRFSGRGVEKYVAAHWTAPYVFFASDTDINEAASKYILFETCVINND